MWVGHSIAYLLHSTLKRALVRCRCSHAGNSTPADD